MSQVQHKAAFKVRRIVKFSESWYLSICFASLMALVANIELVNSAWRAEPAKPAPVTVRVPPEHVVVLDEKGAVTHTYHKKYIFSRGSVTKEPVRASLLTHYENLRRPLRFKQYFSLWAGFFALALMFSKASRRLSPGRGALMHTQLAFYFAGF